MFNIHQLFKWQFIIIKKGAETIINRGGIIRKFENLGFKPLPHRMKHETEIFSEAK